MNLVKAYFHSLVPLMFTPIASTLAGILINSSFAYFLHTKVQQIEFSVSTTNKRIA